MTSKSARQLDPPDDGLGLVAFRKVPAPGGLPLDQLSDALAGRLNSGDDPYHAATPADAADDAVVVPSEGACEITPRSILEAMLFVGSPQNEPLTSQAVAGLMRGVRPAEIDALVRELNETYARRRCPYTIVAEGSGYRLVLVERYAGIREKFHGRARRARLSSAAIEVLAAVAYNGPITADEISRLRGTPSGHILTQLVRRQLLRLERGATKPRRAVYLTTPRFLELFGLESLDDLPRGSDLRGDMKTPRDPEAVTRAYPSTGAYGGSRPNAAIRIAIRSYGRSPNCADACGEHC